MERKVIRICHSLTVTALFGLCIFADKIPAAEKTRVLDGVYELISETVSITKPETNNVTITADDWKGLWFFKDGYFSMQMMKRRRPEWTVGNYPSNPSDFGFRSSAGPYEGDGKKLELSYEIHLTPTWASRSAFLEYELEGDLLTLVEYLHPYIESTVEGKVVTVLKRIKRE
jgi:hypothetical protein